MEKPSNQDIDDFRQRLLTILVNSQPIIDNPGLPMADISNLLGGILRFILLECPDESLHQRLSNIAQPWWRQGPSDGQVARMLRIREGREPEDIEFLAQCRFHLREYVVGIMSVLAEPV
jgi:hypothetical protein